jgi:hypothetical protein
MFDLEPAIIEWRAQLRRAGITQRRILDELEAHLRDDIAERLSRGDTPAVAFAGAREQLGQAEVLQAEFGRERSRHPARGLKFIIAGGAAGLCILSVSVVRGAEWAPSLLGAGSFLFALALIYRWFCGQYQAAVPSEWDELSRWTGLAPESNQILELAQTEAPRLGHDFVGTEHVLLGLTQSGSGKLGKILQDLGVDSVRVRGEIEKWIGPAGDFARGAAKPRLTPRAHRVLVLAVEEARRGKQPVVRPEHLFLGLLREKEGVAGLVLRKLGIDVARARDLLRTDG